MTPLTKLRLKWLAILAMFLAGVACIYLGSQPLDIEISDNDIRQKAESIQNDARDDLKIEDLEMVWKTKLQKPLEIPAKKPIKTTQIQTPKTKLKVPAKPNLVLHSILYSENAIAVFGKPGSKDRIRCSVGDKIAEGRVTSIKFDEVTIEIDNQQFVYRK